MTNFIGDFFKRSRTLDPTTSHQAAQQIKTVAPKHMEMIHNCLHEHGPLGKDGIARLTGLNGNQIARRLPEMASMTPPLVKETGQLVSSDAGRQEREWKAL
jgi:hypothetical protein